MGVTGAQSDQNPPHAEIRAALGKISLSQPFGEKSRATAILSYVVNEELEGRGDLLKAYPIGVDVLGRGSEFDPGSDSIVRVEVMRLRAALARYYETEGAEDQAIIALPKGTYRPKFSIAEKEVPAEPEPSQRPRWILPAALAALVIAALGVGLVLFRGSETERATGPEIARNAISLLVRDRPEALQSDAERERSKLLFRQLRLSLSRNESLAVFAPDVSETGQSRTPETFDFIIDGSVELLASDRRLSIELLNWRTNTLVWGNTFELDAEPDSAEQDAIIAEAVRELYPQIFGASKEALENRDPETLTAYQLFVASTWVPGYARSTLAWEKERLQLAQMAVEKDPEFGPAYSVIADKLIYLASINPPSNTPEARSEAEASAIRAQDLAPGDANSLFNVATYYWHAGKIAASRRVLGRIMDLDPDFGFAVELRRVFPYTCTVAPDEIVRQAEAFDESLGTDNPVRWVTLTWLGMLHLNRGEDELALDAEQRAAQVFQTPDTLMRHAVILNNLGRDDEALVLLKSQRSNWPTLSAAHFAEVTMPRRCHEFPDAAPLLEDYSNLSKAVAGKLE